MKIEITQDDLEMKINKTTPLTRELFAVYSKYFNENNKQDKEVKMEEGEPILHDEKPLKDRKVMFRAPNNTALFLNWVESNNIHEFEVDDFVNAFGAITKESAEKIISHQIHKGILNQMSNNSFTVNIKKLKEENNESNQS